MRVLWIEDQPCTEIGNKLPKGLVKKTTIASAIVYINGSFDKFDAVFLDIDLTADGDLQDDIKAIKENLNIDDPLAYFPLDNADELRRKGGFIIYNYLVEKGFPKGRIAFLTGNADKSDIAYIKMIDDAVAEVTELIDNKALTIIDDQINKWFNLIQTDNPDRIQNDYRKFVKNLRSSDPTVWLEVLLIGLKVLYQKEIIKEYWDMILTLDDSKPDLLKYWIITANNTLNKFNALDVPSNTYEEFKRHFKGALTSLPEAISKSDENCQDRIDEKIGSINSNHYLTLRRGIIDACYELRDNDSINFELKKSTTKKKWPEDEDALKGEIKDKLAELRAMLPMIEPVGESKNRLLKRMARAIVHDWESYYALKATFGWLLRTARNWLAHEKGTLSIKVEEKDIAFFFILHIRSVFKTLPESYAAIENKLLSLFEPMSEDLVHSSVNKGVLFSYYTMHKMYEFIKAECKQCERREYSMEFSKFTSSCREHLQKGHVLKDKDKNLIHYNIGEKMLLSNGMALLYQSFFHVLCKPKSKTYILSEPNQLTENDCIVLNSALSLEQAEEVESLHQPSDNPEAGIYYKLACAFLPEAFGESNCTDYDKKTN